MSDTEAVSVARLIELVKERPVLWDRQEEVYKNRKLTRQAWAEICEALIDNYHDLGEQERAAIGRSIIGKWANLRDNWLRYWRKRQELLRVGSSTKSLKKYIHHDQLLFLSKVYDPEGQQEVEEIQVDVDVISDPEYESTVEFDETSQNSWNNLQYSQFPAPPLQLDQSERHLYFFHSILPMICDFDDDQVLELHAGVLEWVKRVRQRGFCNLQGYHSMDYGLQESNISSAGLSKMKSEVLTQSNCLCNSASQTLIKKEPKSDLHLTLNSSTKTKSNFKSPEIGGDFSESDVKQTVVCDKSEFVSLKDTINSLEKVIKTLDTRLFVKQDDSGNNFGSLLSQLSPKKIQSLKRKIVKEVVKEGFKKTKVGYASIESERQERLMVFNPASAKSTIVMEGEDGSGRVGPPGKSLAPSILRKSLQKLPMK